MSFKKKVTIIFLIFLAILLLLFSFANHQPVFLSFNPFVSNDPLLTFEAPLFVWLFLMLAFGFMMGYCYAKLLDRKYKKAFKAKQKALKALEEKKIENGNTL